MQRIGIIDNLSHIDEFRQTSFLDASAEEVLTATGRNTGNVAFVFAVNRILSSPSVRVGWGWSPDEIKQRREQLVVCCANQIGAHSDLGGWANRLERFELPVAFIGLGACRWPDEEASNFDRGRMITDFITANGLTPSAHLRALATV
jgi:hypothetical protein